MALTASALGPQHGTLRVRLRPDTPAGVCIAPGKDLMPGEEGDVPVGIALNLIATGRATRVVVEAPVAPEVIVARDPVPAHRDPVSAKKRR